MVDGVAVQNDELERTKIKNNVPAIPLAFRRRLDGGSRVSGAPIGERDDGRSRTRYLQCPREFENPFDFLLHVGHYVRPRVRTRFALDDGPFRRVVE